MEERLTINYASAIETIDGHDIRDSEEHRKSLLRQLNAGEPIEVVVDAITLTEYNDRPNKNYIGFSKKAMQGLAKTAPLTPVVRDHRLDTDSSIGYSTAAKVEKLENGFALRETLVINETNAVRALLQKRFTNFSVSVDAQVKDIKCLTCKTFIDECYHEPGELLENGSRVTWQFQNATMIERSWTLNPAAETSIQKLTTFATKRKQLKEQKEKSMADEHKDTETIIKELKAERDFFAQEKERLENDKAEITTKYEAVVKELNIHRYSARIDTLKSKQQLSDSQVTDIHKYMNDGEFVIVDKLLTFAEGNPATGLDKEAVLGKQQIEQSLAPTTYDAKTIALMGGAPEGKSAKWYRSFCLTNPTLLKQHGLTKEDIKELR